MTRVGEDVVVEACALLVGMGTARPRERQLRRLLQRTDAELPRVPGFQVGRWAPNIMGNTSTQELLHMCVQCDSHQPEVVKQPKRPTEAWTTLKWSIHTVESDSATEGNAGTRYTRVNLKNIPLSDVSQIQKDTYCVVAPP